MRSNDKALPCRYLIVGKIGKTYGVKGWVKIHSFTQPETNIVNYSPWHVSFGKNLLSLTACKKQGNFLIGFIENYDTPEKSKTLVNADILILKSQLPNLDSSHTQEYYWTDLIGLDVYNLEKVYLGKIDNIFNTGANDILVIINDQPRRHCEDEVQSNPASMSGLLRSARNDAGVKRNIPHHTEILIPYIMDKVIKSIDLDEKKITVDWQEDWL